MPGYWVDATPAPDGVMWLDSFGAVYNISKWYGRPPANPPRPCVFFTGPNYADNFGDGYPGTHFMTSALICVSINN